MAKVLVAALEMMKEAMELDDAENSVGDVHLSTDMDS